MLPLVRYGVHRERNSEARYVCQPLHVPWGLQFWFHKRSTCWSFTQSAGLQLWLVPLYHVLYHKQTSSVFNESFRYCILVMMIRCHIRAGEYVPLQTEAFALPPSRWQHIIVKSTLPYFSDYDAPLSEAGEYTPKYHLIRDLFSRYNSKISTNKQIKYVDTCRD